MKRILRHITNLTLVEWIAWVAIVVLGTLSIYVCGKLLFFAIRL
jgi:hypothetical protein